MTENLTSRFGITSKEKKIEFVNNPVPQNTHKKNKNKK